MNRRMRSFRGVECLEQKQMLAADLLGGMDIDTRDNPTWFVANSFSFGVEREMKESGEKGGTVEHAIAPQDVHDTNQPSSSDTISAAAKDEAVAMIFVQIPGMGDNSFSTGK